MKRFPVLGTGGSIPWAIAEEAYLDYSKRYGTDQSLERLAQRGGFAPDELDQHRPGWRPTTLLIDTLTAERDHARARVAELEAVIVHKVRPVLARLAQCATTPVERELDQMGNNAAVALALLDAALGPAAETALPDLDLLRKLASGEGGRRTGDLIRRGLIRVEVTEAGRFVLAERATNKEEPTDA